LAEIPIHFQTNYINFPPILRFSPVIRSWLIELMRKQHEEQKGLHDVPAYVEDTGEVNWLVNDAMHMEVPIPVVAQSVMQLMASRNKEVLVVGLISKRVKFKNCLPDDTGAINL
jgi:6-phosphogluconate dehydrogenase (decarboxylating)